MKLNKNDRIKYDDSIYKVIAIVWNTVYLQKVSDVHDVQREFDYTMDQLHENGYKDVEIIK